MKSDVHERILTIARDWIGTPYRHQASVKGAGTDCLGLVRGIWRELYGEEPERIPPYTPNWAEENGVETLLFAAERWLLPVSQDAAKTGDVILFRLIPKTPCKHVAILASETSMIHAYAGRAVTETPLVPWWRKRWERSFSFPSIL